MRIVFIVASIALCLAAPPAAAQTGDLFANCNGDIPPQPRIAGCTRLLNTPGLKPQDRAEALWRRAWAYDKLRNYAAALNDINRAIALDPGEPDYYITRGLIYVKLGRILDAKRDLITADNLLTRSGKRDEFTAAGLVTLAGEITEAEKAAAAKRGPAGGAAPRREAEPAPAGPFIEFRIRNATGVPVGVAFYAQSRNWCWPDCDKQYTFRDANAHTIRIDCQRGETVCWGAWRVDNPSRYWGVGPNNEHNCRTCCYTCDGTTTPIEALLPSQ